MIVKNCLTLINICSANNMLIFMDVYLRARWQVGALHPQIFSKLSSVRRYARSQHRRCVIFSRNWSVLIDCIIALKRKFHTTQGTVKCPLPIESQLSIIHTNSWLFKCFHWLLKALHIFGGSLMIAHVWKAPNFTFNKMSEYFDRISEM